MGVVVEGVVIDICREPRNQTNALFSSPSNKACFFPESSHESQCLPHCRALAWRVFKYLSGNSKPSMQNLKIGEFISSYVIVTLRPTMFSFSYCRSRLLIS